MKAQREISCSRNKMIIKLSKISNINTNHNLVLSRMNQKQQMQKNYSSNNKKFYNRKYRNNTNNSKLNKSKMLAYLNLAFKINNHKC